MAFRHLRVWMWALASTLLVTSCNVDLSVPEGARIGCTTSDECPPGFICREEAGICLEPSTDASDRAELVEESIRVLPESLKADALLQVSFSLRGTVVTAPSVALGFPESRPLTLESVTRADTQTNYVFAYRVTGIEESGSVDVMLTYIDQTADVVTSKLGSVNLDFRAPGLRVGSVIFSDADRVVRSGQGVTLAFEADEPLGRAAQVWVGDTLSMHAQQISTTQMEASFVIPELDDGAMPIRLVLRDLAGNQSELSLGMSSVVDNTMPDIVGEVTDIQPSTLAVAPHNVVRVSFSTSELLADAPSVYLFPTDGSGSAVLELTALGTDQATTSWSFARAVETTDADGLYSLWVYELEDRAGNRRDPVYAGQMTIDSVAPAIVMQSVYPTIVRLGDTVNIQFSVDEHLDGVPVLSAGGNEIEMEAVSTRDFEGSVVIDESFADGSAIVNVAFLDAAGNTGYETLDSFDVDTVAPRILDGSFNLDYEITNGCELERTEVTAMSSGDSVVISFGLSEVISGDGSDGALVSVSLNTGDGSASFEPLLSNGNFWQFELLCTAESCPVGNHTIEIQLTDAAGNVKTHAPDTFPSVKVVGVPSLTIDQGAVTFLRSPWGQAVEEDLGDYTMPAGPINALTPLHPLSGDESFASHVFSVGEDNAVRRIKVFADRAGTTLMGIMEPSEDGRWLREVLANYDVSTVWLRAIDESCQFSDPDFVRSVEWVATPMGNALGSSPHVTYLHRRADLAQGHNSAGFVNQRSRLVTGELFGADTNTVEVSSAPQCHELTPEVVPGSRVGPAIAYHAGQDKVFMFSGAGSAEAASGFLQPHSDVWQWDGLSWRAVNIAGTNPAARIGTAFQYDAARDQALLFGGLTGVSQNDLWGFDGVEWTQIYTTNKPIKRYVPGSTYDTRRGWLIVFGGRDLGNGDEYMYNDLWAFDGTDWQLLHDGSGTAPSPRAAASITYDEERDVLVLYGGGVEFYRHPIGDTWEWDMQTGVWTEKTPVGLTPPDTTFGSMVYHPGWKKAVIHGGGNTRDDGLMGCLGQTWTWDGESWEMLPETTGERPEMFGTLIYNPRSEQLHYFGGTDVQDNWFAGDQQINSDIVVDGPIQWVLDAEEWVPTIQETTRPALRVGHGISYDPNVGGMVLSMGRLADVLLEDIWVFGQQGWSEMQSDVKPTGRVDHKSVYFPPAQSTMVIGGATWWHPELETRNYFEDSWGFNEDEWIEQTGATGRVAGSLFASVAYDEVRERLVMVTGDMADEDAYVEAGVWEWDGVQWEHIAPDGSEPAGRDHACASFSTELGEVIYFGGCLGEDCNGTLLNDVWSWDGVRWLELDIPNAPPPQYYCRMARDSLRDEVIMLPGYEAASAPLPSDTFWRFSVDGWQEVDLIDNSSEPTSSLVYDSGNERYLSYTPQLGRVDEVNMSVDRHPAIDFHATFLDALFQPDEVTSIRTRLSAQGEGPEGGGLSVELWRSRQVSATERVGFSPIYESSCESGCEGLESIDVVIDESEALDSFVQTGINRISMRVRPLSVAGARVVEHEPSIVADSVEVRVRYTARYVLGASEACDLDGVEVLCRSDLDCRLDELGESRCLIPLTACHDVDCGQGSCSEFGADVWCECFSGYYYDGETCVVPCEGQICDDVGSCSFDGVEPLCECIEGYSTVGVRCQADGGCDNDYDRAVLDDDSGNVLPAVLNCLGERDPRTCFRTELESDTIGLSPECAGCGGQLLAGLLRANDSCDCALTDLDCLKDCADNSGVTAAFENCSGVLFSDLVE